MQVPPAWQGHPVQETRRCAGQAASSTRAMFPGICLLAVPESGLIFDTLEIIGAENLSQRYHFTAQIAHQLPSLQAIVHDDACHLKAMCQKEQGTSPLASRLARHGYHHRLFSQRGPLRRMVQDDLLARLAVSQLKLPSPRVRNSAPWAIASTTTALGCRSLSCKNVLTCKT